MCFGNDIQIRHDRGSACKLAIRNDPKLLETDCYDEKFIENSFANAKSNDTSISVRTVCDIKCNGADRDSVISKIPNFAYACIRWYNYNTLKIGIKFFGLL
ncbi:unnamed protein product [Thelazia callipaeda]|uniref:DUF7808 domain-containing protein n=1 Tax=Thelazia callipaeda TaxID=103827 RepID=A0A0N5CTU6_THECL|nr:unnamed protein product [Thelazia callipaeda]